MAVFPHGETTAIIVFGLFFGLLALGYIWKWYRKYRQRKLAHVSKTISAVRDNSHILLKGTASGPSHPLPSSGIPVAFYAITILTMLNVVSEPRRAQVRVGPFRLGSGNPGISYSGFKVFDHSGDFTMLSAGTSYGISISSAFAAFKKGKMAFARVVIPVGKNKGAPEDLMKMTMDGATSEAVLDQVFNYSLSVRKKDSTRFMQGNKVHNQVITVNYVHSSVDSAVNEYTGTTVPQGVKAILERKGITLKEDDGVQVIEIYIPLGKEFYALGTYDDKGRIFYGDQTVGLILSYTDPEVV